MNTINESLATFANLLPRAYHIPDNQLEQLLDVTNRYAKSGDLDELAEVLDFVAFTISCNSRRVDPRDAAPVAPVAPEADDLVVCPGCEQYAMGWSMAPNFFGHFVCPTCLAAEHAKERRLQRREDQAEASW